jgi:hypothetical protein
MAAVAEIKINKDGVLVEVIRLTGGHPGTRQVFTKLGGCGIIIAQL